MKKSLTITLLLLMASPLLAEPLNMTISGKAAEKIKLETLVPSPDIPTAEALSLSLDGGENAAAQELEPLLVSEAALDMDLTSLPMPGLSAIPDAPYIVQAVPRELEMQRDNKLRRGEKRIRFTHWEFKVSDEYNTLWHEQTGEGFPPQPLTWDGNKNGEFVLKPNLTYVSTLKLTAHGEPDRTIVGESVRFLAFLRQTKEDTIIEIGQRIYKQDEAQFSLESNLYLNDLASRLSQNIAFYQDATQSEWQVVLKEPENQQHLAAARKNLWKTTLGKILGKSLPDKNFIIETSQSEESRVSIIFPRTRPPLTDLALRGEARANLDPIIDSMSAIAKVSEQKNMIVVDLRHDRIFHPGSAYVKEAALPYIYQAIEKVKSMKEERKILIRSYTQKLPTDRKDKSEDPKLTATRSKVLFMLFARETLTQK